eukprot:CAMPEP_0170280808 /NCGR_PEP_ID=MMETSP0116_2-20130129/40423_1 /TAXON_ID=400756 /ORGANISM="Durinskia baltica, Strain CSIRO CS-38" /LENGTH=376 /DNA_ID=CAMNT_0010532149 /DNA_START=18 /DNA_END=1148 /DNA_ORIENTATION=+
MAFGRCMNCCLVLAVLVAALVGFLLSHEHPIAPIFVYMNLAMGIGKPKTEAVGDDVKPAARPEGEKFLSLPSGASMPANGIGMCCRPTAYEFESVRRTVLWYLLLGGRHIDTADVYTNHVAVGQGIRDAIARGVPRSEMFVTTKVWPDSFGFASTTTAVRRMAKELGLDYIDLVLMHAPRNLHPRLLLHTKFGFKDDEFVNHDCRNQTACRAETWRALSALIDEGLVKDAGVSNFQVHHMKQLQNLGLKPISVHQMQYHPWVSKTQAEVVSFCHRNKIAITAYFSLGGFNNLDKALGVDIVHDMAAAHKKRPGQILLRWALENNVSIIPGTGNPKHMRENLDIYGFSLSSAEMEKLNSLSGHPMAKEFFLFEDLAV